MLTIESNEHEIMNLLGKVTAADPMRLSVNEDLSQKDGNLVFKGKPIGIALREKRAELVEFLNKRAAEIGLK